MKPFSLFVFSPWRIGHEMRGRNFQMRGEKARRWRGRRRWEENSQRMSEWFKKRGKGPSARPSDRFFLEKNWSSTEKLDGHKRLAEKNKNENVKEDEKRLKGIFRSKERKQRRIPIQIPFSCVYDPIGKIGAIVKQFNTTWVSVFLLLFNSFFLPVLLFKKIGIYAFETVIRLTTTTRRQET